MKSFAVIGIGRFGLAIAIKLFELGHEVLAIDKDPDKVDEIADSVTQAVCANPMEPGVISELAINECDVVIVAIGNNLSDSILITMMLKEYGTKYVIAKAQDENHRKVLQKVGADQVVIPEYDAGIKMASQLVSESVFDVIDISDKYSIADLAIPHTWIGKTLVQLDLRRKYGINVIAVRHKDTGKITTISPVADHAFTDNDIIVIIGKKEDINILHKIK